MPEALYLAQHEDKLVILDEIQRKWHRPSGRSCVSADAARIGVERLVAAGLRYFVTAVG